MQMWGFWTRTRRAHANPSRGPCAEGGGDCIERRRDLCARRSLKTSATPARTEGAQEATGTYVYVDNFR